MKNLFLLLIALLFLLSCSAIKMIAKEDVISRKNCTMVAVNNENSLLTLDVEINKSKAKFMFDTGATASFLTDSTVVENFTDKKFSSFGTTKSADEKTKKRRIFSTEFNSELFESKNKVLSFIDMPSSKCAIARNFAGIIGMDVFFDKLSMQLDFTNNKICNIDSEQQKAIILDGYQQIKSECKLNQIFVFLTIDYKEYKFKLDTGFTGNIVMPINNKLTFNYKKIELDGSFYQSATGHTNGHETFYEKVPVIFGDKKVSTKINVSGSIKAQNIGINFIKGFDWIIDYNNNMVFIKQNKNEIISEFTRKISYYAKNITGNLEIVVKEKNQTLYNLGDQITSVNNQPITPENICQMQELLNNTQDWSTLQLQIVPAKK